MISHSGPSSSASQYIRPDYLPSPSTMDAQKSPLAMLAATCNSIGAPDLPKNIKNVELPPSKKSSPVSTGGSENKRPRRSTDTPEKPDKKLENHRHHQEKSEDITKERERDRKEKPAEEKIEKPEKSSVIVERTERKASKSPSSKSSPTPPKSASAASMTPFNPAAIPTSNPFTGLSSSMSDPLNFSARLKTPLQLPGMMPYCRDPFCYGCSTSMHCGTNPNVPMDYSALSSYSSLSNGLSSNKNLICSWVNTGGSYCGKHFLTSEELFAHLRTHTNLSVSSLSPDPLQSAAYSYAAYLSRFPSLALNQPRYNLYKSPVPGAPLSGYSGLWPNGPNPGFFSPPPFSYYRPPF